MINMPDRERPNLAEKCLRRGYHVCKPATHEERGLGVCIECSAYLDYRAKFRAPTAISDRDKYR